MQRKLTERQLDVLGVVGTDRNGVTASEVGEYHLPIGYRAAYAALTALERRSLVAATYTTGKRGRAYQLTRTGNALLVAEGRA